MSLGMYDKDSEKTVTLPDVERLKLENPAVRFSGSTHIGKRNYQQDSFLTGVSQSGTVYAIMCDGMGGLADGEKASKTAVEMFADAIEKLPPGSDIPGFFTGQVYELNEAIYSLPEDAADYGKAGTTLTAALIFDNTLYWVSVGDSRVYIIRDEQIVAVTRDHSYSLELEELVRQGRMTAEEAENDPQRNALVSYLGADEVRLIDLNRNPFTLEHGDIVLLCSDGLYRSLSDADILDIIKRYSGDVELCANVLTLNAVDKGGQNQDNTTVVILAYQ